MAENKADIEADRDRLAAENEQLRSQLASVAAGTAVGRAAVPQHTFQLSQAGLNELELYGVTNVNGRLYTREQALKAMADAGQTDGTHTVDIKEAPAGTRNDAAIAMANRAASRDGIAGLDYIPVTGVDQTVAGRADQDETDSE